jgi:hypothetical protein
MALFYGLTQRITNFRLVETKDGSMALCLKDRKVASGYGGPLILSDDPCPDVKPTGQLPEIVAEHPVMLNSGLVPPTEPESPTMNDGDRKHNGSSYKKTVLVVLKTYNDVCEPSTECQD